MPIALALAAVFVLSTDLTLTPAYPPQLPKQVIRTPDTKCDESCIEGNAKSLDELLRKVHQAIKSDKNVEIIGTDLSGELQKIVEAASTDFKSLKPLVEQGEPINRLIFAIHSAYQELKHKAMRVGGKTWKDTAYGQAVVALGSATHDLMSRRGLREVLAAVLDTGFVLTDSGNSVIKDARNSLQKTATGLILWESKHFGDDGPSKWDFSFGGDLGMVPALGLVVRSDGEADPTKNRAMTIRSFFQNSFRWKDSSGSSTTHDRLSTTTKLTTRPYLARRVEFAATIGSVASATWLDSRSPKCAGSLLCLLT